MIIGASIYLGLDDYLIEDNLKYLDLLKKKNIDYVFVSGHMEEAKDTFYDELAALLKKAKENNIKIVIDLNKQKYEELKANGLIKLISGIRIDYGFTYDEIYDLLEENFDIEFNASTINFDFINYFLNKKVELNKFRISYNFYPKPYTGMDYETVKSKTEYFHSYGLKVIAYIPSLSGRRPPLYLGLPTIEDQRNGLVIANVSELLLCGVDGVCFGDAYASEEEIDDVCLDYSIVLIPISLNSDIDDEMKNMLLKEHRNRIDNNSYMVRSSIRNSNIKEFNNNVIINKKDITIDNRLFKRYAGEVCIALKEMPANAAINVVGRCLCNDFLIDNIKGGQKFKFIVKE